MFSTSILLDGRPCVAADSARFPPAAGRANSYWCPLGPLPGRAWVLVRGAEARRLREAGPFHRLTFREGGAGGGGELNFPGLVLVAARRLAGGAAGDPEALHLVELADRRLLAARFSDTGRVAIHLRAYAQGEEFLGGTEGFTWHAAAAALWEPLAPLFGPFPGLPFTPVGSPPPRLHLGENAWWALAELLRDIGCTVRYDPFADRVEIVALASEPAVGPASGSLLSAGDPARLLLAGESFEGPASRLPETIRVYFPDHLLPYGQERDTELEEHWLLEHGGAAIDIPTAAPGAAPGTVLPLWDELPRLFDEDHQLTNATELQARAAERAARWLARAGAESRHEVRAGFTRSLPDSAARALLWRAWGVNGGAATERITRGGLPVKIRGGWSLAEGMQWDDRQEFPSRPATSQLAPLRTARLPNFPRVANVVEVWVSEGEVLGARVEPNNDGLFPGRLRRWVAGELVELGPCWIHLVDLPPRPEQPEPPTARHGERYLGRLSGIETSAGATLPLYLAHRGTNEFDACLCHAAHAAESISYESPATLALDTESEPSPWIAPDGGELLLRFTGPARFAYRVAAERESGSGEAVSRVWLERQAEGEAFEELPTSSAFLSHLATGGRASAAHPGEPLAVRHGDRVRLRAERQAGGASLRTLPHGVSLLVCPCPQAELILPGTNLAAAFSAGASVGNESAQLGALTLHDHNLVQRGEGHVFPWSWDFQNASPVPPAEVQYFSAPAAGVLDPAGSFTLSFWVRLDTAAQAHALLSLGEPGELPVLEIARRSGSHPSEADELAADLQGESTSLTTLSAGTLPIGAWHLVFFRWDAAAHTAALALDDGPPVTAALGEPLAGAGELELRVGYSAPESGGETDGRLDALRLWRRPLAEYERAEEWNGGSGRAAVE